MIRSLRPTLARATSACALLVPLLIATSRAAAAQGAPRLPANPPAVTVPSSWREVGRTSAFTIHVEPSAQPVDSLARRAWVRFDHNGLVTTPGDPRTPFRYRAILLDVVCVESDDDERFLGDWRAWTRTYHAANGSVVKREDDPQAEWDLEDFSPADEAHDALCGLPLRTGGGGSSGGGGGGGVPATPRAHCTAADHRRTLAVGDSVRGTLDTSDCIYSAEGAYAEYYRLVLTVPTTVRFDLMSTAFDAYLMVYGDAGGSPGTSTDGGGTGRDARLLFPLGAGTHWIVVKAKERGQSGSYLLTLTRTGGGSTNTSTASTTTPSVPAGTCSIATSSRTIALGASIASAFDASDCRRSASDRSPAEFYRLDLAAPTTVQLDMRSTRFDAYLALLSSDGTHVASNDDGGGGRDARITRALGAGTYWVVANALAAASAGDFTLSVRTAGSSGTATTTGTTPARASSKRPCTLADVRGVLEVARVAVDSLQRTDCVRSAGDTSYADYWRMTLTETMTLRLDLSSADFDAHLAVLDAGGRVVAGTGSGGVGRDAQVTRSFAAGTHYVVANSAAASQTGVYTLTATRVHPSAATTTSGGSTGTTATTPAAAAAAPACAITGVRETLYVGEVRRGALERSTCRVPQGPIISFQFDVATAALRMVDLESADFDPILAIYDARGVEIARDDDSGDGNASRVARTFTPGTYFVVVRGYGGKTAGAFTLKVN